MVIKEEKTSIDLLLAFSRLMLKVCSQFYSLLPSIDSLLSTLTSQVKRIVKKKNSIRILAISFKQLPIRILSSHPNRVYFPLDPKSFLCKSLLEIFPFGKLS